MSLGIYNVYLYWVEYAFMIALVGVLMLISGGAFLSQWCHKKFFKRHEASANEVNT